MASNIAPAAAAPLGERDEPTTDLIREALDGTRELVRLEVALARDEITTELGGIRTAAVSLGAGAALAVSALTMFMVTIASAFAGMWLAALIIGVILLVGAGGLAMVGLRALPKRPLEDTKDRIVADLKQFRERIA